MSVRVCVCVCVVRRQARGEHGSHGTTRGRRREITDLLYHQGDVMSQVSRRLCRLLFTNSTLNLI